MEETHFYDKLHYLEDTWMRNKIWNVHVSAGSPLMNIYIPFARCRLLTLLGVLQTPFCGEL